MVLIVGGAYQGKRDYAENRFRFSEDEIFTCRDTTLDFSKPCMDCLEEFTYACVQQGVEPADVFRANREQWKDSVLICQDISCGVVPLGAEMREWRQATGRLCQYLSKEADEVVRIFCGLEQKLK